LFLTFGGKRRELAKLIHRTLNAVEAFGSRLRLQL
jgi:hypothetical protein